MTAPVERPTRKAKTDKKAGARSAPGVDGPWADRGWYLAVEYGVLARDKFLKRLPHLRALGAFKELLEPGGAILYRNIFRKDQLAAAWELFTALRPWQERLVCYVKGAVVPAKDAQDALWCAAFLAKERPCRGGPASGKGRPAGCAGGRVLLGPGSWDEAQEHTRHALTFSRVDEKGVLVFDRDAIAAFVRERQGGALCPSSPGQDPDAFARAFADVPVHDLGWPLVATLPATIERRLGKKALEGEHGFVQKKGEPGLPPHAHLELRAKGDRVLVRRVEPATPPSPSAQAAPPRPPVPPSTFGPQPVPVAPPRSEADLKKERATTIATQVRLPGSALALLREGVPLRAVCVQEGFVRLEGGHYEVEQRFVFQTRAHLGPEDDPADWPGWGFETHPRATPGWDAWADRVSAGLP